MQPLNAAIIQAKIENISNKEHELRLSLSNCIAAASDAYFNSLDVVTLSVAPDHENASYYSSTPLDSLLMPELFSKSKWSMLVKKPKGKSGTWLKNRLSDGYIMQLRVWSEIDWHLDFLKRSPSWNPHAKFIIISVRKYDAVKKVVSSIIQRLWDLDVLDGVVLFPDPTRNNTFSVYSWFPYDGDSCGNEFNKVKRISRCSFGNLENRRLNWFPNKIPDKLSKCPIKVRTLIYPPFVINSTDLKRGAKKNTFLLREGLDVRLVDLLGEIANLSIEYYIIKDEDMGIIKNPQNESTGVLGSLIRREYDIAVGSLSATFERFSALDQSSAYFQDSIGFCVPHAEEKTEWMKLSEIVGLRTAVLIQLLFLCLSTLITLLARYTTRNERKLYRRFPDVFLRLFGTLTGNAVHKPPITTRIRFIMFLWIIFSMELDTFYESQMMSTLTNPDFAYQMKDLDGILKDNMRILLTNDTYRYFEGNRNSFSQSTQLMMKRWQTCEDLDRCLRRTAYRRDTAIATPRLYISYAKNRFVSKKGWPLIYCFDQNIVSFPVVVYMRRGFPFLRRIDKIVSTINSAGFLQWWENNLFVKQKVKDNFGNENPSDSEYESEGDGSMINFQHILPIFVIFFGGLGFSIVVFIGEILAFYWMGTVKKRWFKFNCRKR